MDISLYFEPINTEHFLFHQFEATKRYGNIIQRYDEQGVFPDLSQAKIALIYLVLSGRQNRSVV